MRNINQTKTLSDLLNSFTFGDNTSKGKSFYETIKQSTIFSFWNDIVGVKLAKFTKPTKIKLSKLYVSAKSPTIIQELELVKQKIIAKANTYALALGFEIKDIVFDYKSYCETNEVNGMPEEQIQYYNNENIARINIDENYEKEITKNVEKINFLSDKQKKKLIEKIINVKKAQTIRLHN